MSRTKIAALVAMALLVGAALLAVEGADSNPPSGTPVVLVSRQLMESRGLHEGDLIRLAADPSGTRSQVFRVLAEYEPTPDPMRFAQARLEARLHLPDLLALTADPTDADEAESVGAINVGLVNPSDAEAFAHDVVARVPGASALPTSAPNERTSTFLVIERFHLAVAVVTMIGSGVFLLALMMMMADERRETVGTLRLIGLPRQRILLQVLTEGALIAAAGTIGGIAFAISTEGLFNQFFQWRYDTTLVFVQITPGVVAQSALLALPLGVVASVVASWTLLRRRPLALIRR